MSTTTADAGRRYPAAYAALAMLAIVLIVAGVVASIWLPFRIAGLGPALGLTLWWLVGSLAEARDRARGR